MRRRLEGVEEEYELKVTELQTDISGLRNILQQTEVNTRQAEREKSLLITQLSEQNQRLTTQLKDVSSGHNEGEIKAESEQTIVCLTFENLLNENGGCYNLLCSFLHKSPRTE